MSLILHFNSIPFNLIQSGQHINYRVGAYDENKYWSWSCNLGEKHKKMNLQNGQYPVCKNSEVLLSKQYSCIMIIWRKIVVCDFFKPLVYDILFHNIDALVIDHCIA